MLSKKEKSLKKFRWILILILTAVHISAEARNADTHSDKILSIGEENRSTTQEQADSIMRLAIGKAAQYRHTISMYEAEIYIKGRTEILKQNILMRLAHHIFPVDWRNKDMLFEMVSQSRYNAPYDYIHNIQAVNGNSVPNESKRQEALAFLNLNVYSPTAYDDAIFLPIADNAFRFYSFNLDEILWLNGQRVFKIRFLPKQWSQKLVCGHLYIFDRSWGIHKIDMNGRYSFAEFNVVMEFGRDYRRFFLPEKADLFLRYKLLGNVVATSYHSSFSYKKVERMDEEEWKRKWKSLDLTSYTELPDTVPIVRDTAYWHAYRDIPLSREEELLYARRETKADTLPKDTVRNIRQYIHLTSHLTNSVNMDYKSTRIKYSGLLNPFQLGYSARNGITYKQQFRISKTFDRDKQLRLHPEIGFVFKRKQIFFKLRGDWEYLPQRRGALSIEVGNGNESYSSDITDQINALPENPLRGKNFPTGPRFVDMHEAYDQQLIRQAKTIAAEKGIKVQEGVYLATQGPTYETPAEYKMFRTWGADAVGMSTVPEVIVANHCGIKCFGISVITDLGVEGRIVEVSHEEVQKAADAVQPLMADIMREMINRA